MRPRIRSLPLLVLLGAPLVPGLQQPAVGQISGANIFLIENVTLDFAVRPNTVAKPGEGLGTFLAERTRVSSSEDGKPIQLGLWVEAVSQREGSLGRYDSHPIRFEPGHTYPGKAWIPEPDEMNELTAPMFGDRRKEGIIISDVVVLNHEEQYAAVETSTSKEMTAFPDVCKDAPYALVIGVSAPELKGSPSVPKSVACLGS